jgi:predicted GNAT family N-acyltransferase
MIDIKLKKNLYDEYYMTDNTYCVRNIEYNDYYKGYLDLINVFTRYPESKTYDEFCKVLDKITNQNSHIFVIEQDNKIISSIKCMVEQKIHNNFKCVLHIEDLVTDVNYRKKGLASILLKHIINLANIFNCYKIVLCSNPENEEFYLKQHFIKKGTEFSLYI